ncbi:MAG TPA: YkgJ family cysteine cluster protein [Acidobacteriota bacterium]|nr:YkgJ family cysteine cluster protein [Acidobacteriota bacterium]
MNWYKDGLKFECTKCGKCCTGGPGFVWITLSELYRIAEYLGLDDTKFAAHYVRKVGDRMSLIERPNGDCIFFDQGCTIYPVRPTQCRTFPFWKENLVKPSAWESAAQQCEGIHQGKRYTENEIEQILESEKST